jgi:hypothetical protein
MSRHRLGGTLILASFLHTLAGSALGDEPSSPPRKLHFPGESRDFSSRLKFADDLAARKKWPDAIDEYQRLIHAAGDVLTPAGTGSEELTASPRSVQLRRLIHARLAASPAEALALYRRRADPQAELLLKQGLADRDAAALRRVADDAFCSRPAEQALDALGDLAFERGEFREALRWWRLLARPASEADRGGPSAGEMLYPDPRGDVARVRAKQVLALLFEGDRAAAAAELRAFRGLHPDARGKLAGREGKYADILAAWLREPPDVPEYRDWPTFAGGPARDRHLPDAPHRRLWAEGPAWRVSLAAGAAEAKRPFLHPVVVEGLAVLADGRAVQAFDLHTGARQFRHDLAADSPAHVHHSLTAADGLLYARGGAAIPPDAKGAPESVLVCLDPGAKGKDRRERWRVAAPAGAVFEGAPAVAEGKAYVTLARLAGGKLVLSVACHDAATGALRWQRDVCEVPDYPAAAAARPRSALLTLAGNQIIYCTGEGAIIALERDTGKWSWAVRYPRRTPPSGEAAPVRELAPCVHAEGRLYAAPRDADRLLCLDPETGRTLWEREQVEVVQLLGCAEGRMVFTTPKGIRAVGCRDGSDRGGWAQPPEGRVSGLGRGLLAGGWAFWPLRDHRLPLRALNVADGTQERGEVFHEPTGLRHLAAGNMAFGHGCLVIATADELLGYVWPETPPARRKPAN